jgi:acyl carrier protein
MTLTNVLDRTRQYIAENFLYMRRDLTLDDGDMLLERGIIDSMGVMELVSFIEQEFDVVVSDEDVTENNLGSLRAIATFVSSRRTSDAKVA